MKYEVFKPEENKWSPIGESEARFLTRELTVELETDGETDYWILSNGWTIARPN